MSGGMETFSSFHVPISKIYKAMFATRRVMKSRKMNTQMRKRPATLGNARQEMERKIPLTRDALMMARTVSGWRTM